MVAIRPIHGFAEDLDEIINRGTTHPASGSVADLSIQIDRFTTHVAELAANAPTAMDTRVCRSVGVRSRALNDVLRTLGDDSTTPSRRLRMSPGNLHDRRTEFEAALRDLQEHVDLL